MIGYYGSFGTSLNPKVYRYVPISVAPTWRPPVQPEVVPELPKFKIWIRAANPNSVVTMLNAEEARREAGSTSTGGALSFKRWIIAPRPGPEVELSGDARQRLDGGWDLIVRVLARGRLAPSAASDEYRGPQVDLDAFIASIRRMPGVVGVEDYNKTIPAVQTVPVANVQPEMISNPITGTVPVVNVQPETPPALPPEKSNTMLYVGVGVAALAYFMLRK